MWTTRAGAIIAYTSPPNWYWTATAQMRLVSTGMGGGNSPKHFGGMTAYKGPDGGTPAKPVGTVWIGSCVQGDVRSRCVRLPGPRARVRAWTVHAALQQLAEAKAKEEAEAAAAAAEGAGE